MNRAERRAAGFRGPRYAAKLLQMVAASPLKPGTVNIAHIGHDADCPFLSRKGPCTCDIEVNIRQISDAGGPK